MSGSKTGSAGAEDFASAAKNDIEDLLQSSNWEERLLAARAKREKIMAQKKKGKVTASDGQQPAAHAEPVAQTPADAPMQARSIRPRKSPAKTRKRPQLRAERRIVPPRARKGLLPLSLPDLSIPSMPDISSFGKSAVVAAACCACLGFGVALGLGVQSDTPAAPLPTQAVQPDIDSQRPVVVQAAFAPQPEPPAASVEDAPEPPAPETAVTQPMAEPPVVDIPPSADTADVVPAPTPLPLFEFEDDGTDKLTASLDASNRPVDAFSLHVYAPGSVPQTDLDLRVADLSGSGLPLADVQRINLTISSPHVRFYNAEDAQIAKALARDLQIEARDFTGRHDGSLGRIEVWLDGRSTAQSYAGNGVRKKRVRHRTSARTELIRLRNDIVRIFR